MSWHQHISQKMPKSHNKPRAFSVHEGCGLRSSTNKSFPLCCLKPWSETHQVFLSDCLSGQGTRRYLPYRHNIPTLSMAGAELKQAVVLWALRHCRTPKFCCVWELNLTNLERACLVLPVNSWINLCFSKSCCLSPRRPSSLAWIKLMSVIFFCIFFCKLTITD